MADLDAAILALADGDSSDGEEAKPTSPSATPKATSPPSQPVADVNRMNETSSNKLNMSHKPSIKVNGGPSRAPKKVRKDDSEEEGEASSPSSHNSLDSAPMSESESDTSPAGEIDDDAPIFPIDGKFYSEQDKAELMSMNEVRREILLSDRVAEQERKLQDLHLRRLLKARETDGKKKRKADAADLEDSPKRKSTRQKTTLGGRKVGDSSTIENYTRQREENKARNEQRRLEGAERRNRKIQESSPLARDSEADADGESEVEWDDRAPSRQPALDEQPAEQIDFEHVRVGRDNFAKVCFYPGFDETITDCYVRVNIGIDKASGDSIYRVGRIAGFTESRPYAMEGSNGKSFTTNQYAKVAIGKSEKEMPFIACSNSRFTTAEFERYVRTLATDELKPPTKPFLISKVTQIDNLLNRSWTADEIEEKLKRSGALQARFSHLARQDIVQQRERAVNRGDEAAIAKLDAELAALEGPKLAFGTKLYKPAPAPSSQEMSQQDRLAELNRANRKANTEDVRKAQRAERKAERLAREAIERGEGFLDPFARVKTRAKTHYDVNAAKLPLHKPKAAVDELLDGKSDGSRGGTPMSRGGTPKPPVKNVTPKKQQIGLPKVGRSCADDDILAAMDFGIEIDI